ncbi:MAG: hypothetical protein AAGD38_17305 [Acidobacteriota bacterium]
MPSKLLAYNATLVDRIDYTSALTTFIVRPDEPLTGDPPFIPGQYVTLGLNNEERPELGSVRRPMSIASAPAEGNDLAFYIRWVSKPESNNPLTHLLWPLAVGDRLYLRPKNIGRFTINHTVGNDDTRLRVCVAAGTGLAPFLSMVREVHMRDPDADLSKWVILHGASYPDDLGYKEELEGLRARGLHYFPTVSRPNEAPDWRGDSGRVEDYFRPERIGELESQLGLATGELDPRRAVILICGLQGTIGMTILRLNDRGFVPETRKLRRALEVPDDIAPTLFFEQYDNTPVIPVNDEEVMGPLRASLAAALANLSEL